MINDIQFVDIIFSRRDQHSKPRLRHKTSIFNKNKTIPQLFIVKKLHPFTKSQFLFFFFHFLFKTCHKFSGSLILMSLNHTQKKKK